MQRVEYDNAFTAGVCTERIFLNTMLIDTNNVYTTIDNSLDYKDLECTDTTRVYGVSTQ